jgi:hypothetical protein
MKSISTSTNDIPENERWLHAPRAAAELQSALIWAIETKPSENYLNDIKDDNEPASLLLKVEAGRTSMRAGLGRSNDEVEASLVARRAAASSQI